MSSRTLPKIFAVIVTHNPPGDFYARIGSVVSEVGCVVIVDNASGDATRAQLDAVQAQFPGAVDVLRNPENMGLAAALNRGIRHASQEGADWLLLLDHDSEPEPGMVPRMLEAYGAYPQKEKIGLIAPEIREHTAPPARYLVLQGKFGFRRIMPTAFCHDDVLAVITSGSLVKAHLFHEIGLMPEHFFIDYLDYDFCLRMRGRGYRILLAGGAVLRHRLGEKTAHHLAGATIVASHHSAARRYTIFRNRLWVWKRHGAAFPGFVMHDMMAVCYDILRILLYERAKLPKLLAIARGICAGLRREPER